MVVGPWLECSGSASCFDGGEDDIDEGAGIVCWVVPGWSCDGSVEVVFDEEVVEVAVSSESEEVDIEVSDDGDGCSRVLVEDCVG